MRRKAVLEMSHYTIQEVDKQAGMHGYRAAGPILPDRLRARGRQHGAGTAEGGEAVLGFAECKMQMDPEAAFCQRHNDK